MPPNTEAASLSAPLAIGAEADDSEASRRAHIDRAYNNSAAFPDVPEWRETWLRRSRAVPIQPLARLDVPYGAAPAQKLDIFPHADCAAATAIFVHGGFWSRNSKETFRFLVRGIHAAGLNAIFVGHMLAPQAGMDQIVGEVRAAAHWTSAHLAELSFALLSSSSFRRSATSATALPREFLISSGLVAIAVPSIANESATGVLVLARWSVAGADVVFARSNAYSTN
jgi:hypothetical protein